MKKAQKIKQFEKWFYQQPVFNQSAIIKGAESFSDRLLISFMLDGIEELVEAIDYPTTNIQKMKDIRAICEKLYHSSIFNVHIAEYREYKKNKAE